MTDEAQWIANVLAGDRQSFAFLVSKYERMAFTLAVRIVGNREEAEEVVQDAFVKMYRSLPDFKGTCKFSSWFYQIVYHTAISSLRSQHFFVDYEEVEAADVTFAEQESASSLLEAKDRKEIISRTLKALPNDEALLLILFYLEECTIEEICQITSLSTSNAKTKLFRARKHFYTALEKKMKQETVNLL